VVHGEIEEPLLKLLPFPSLREGEWLRARANNGGGSFKEPERLIERLRSIRGRPAEEIDALSL
jgi:hypothetical protein